MQVREGAGSQSPYIDQLQAAVKIAETQKKGLWRQVFSCRKVQMYYAV